MPEDGTTSATTDADAQAANAQADAAAQDADQQAQAANDDATGNDGDETELRRARHDAARYRKELRDVQSEFKRLKDAGKSDEEKTEQARAELDASVAKLEEENRGLRVQVAATKAGIRPEAAPAAAALLDRGELAEAESEKDVVRLLKGLRSDHSYLFGSTNGSGDGGEGRRDQQQDLGDDMNARIRVGAGRRG